MLSSSFINKSTLFNNTSFNIKHTTSHNQFTLDQFYPYKIGYGFCAIPTMIHPIFHKMYLKQ